MGFFSKLFEKKKERMDLYDCLIKKYAEYPKIDVVPGYAVYIVIKPNGQQIRVSLQEALKIREEMENGRWIKRIW